MELAPAWWTLDAGFAGAPAWVEVGTGTQAARVCVIGVAGQIERNAARQAIRQAVRAALCVLFRVDPAAIGLHAVSGQAPYAMILPPAIEGSADDAHAAARRVALAFSHDEALSVAAIGLDCLVGIDVMRVADIPDWQAVARDYLGPIVAGALAGQDPDERPAAFARAWSEREARLKCLGRGIGEWQADETAVLAACSCLPVGLPDDYVGCLAVAAATVH